MNCWQLDLSIQSVLKFQQRLRLASVKLFLVLVACLASHQSVVAGPANPHATLVTQPNGDRIQVKMRGDEFQGWMETLNGYTVVKNEATGYLEYAKQGPNGALINSGLPVHSSLGGPQQGPGLLQIPKGLRPPANREMRQAQALLLNEIFSRRLSTKAKANSAPSPTGTWAPTPVSGPKKILVVLVSFTNAALSSGSAAYWSNLVHGASGKTVAKFFQENSFSTATIVPVTHTQPGSPTGVVIAALNQAHPNCGGSCSNSTEVNWINAALAATAPYVNYASLDSNGNGSISVDEALIYFVLAGYETSAGNGLSPSIWAHAWEGPATVAGKTVGHWALNGEMYSATTRMQMGVVTHEMGHAMGGLPDLYDIDGYNEGMGAFSLMAAGSWGAQSGETGGTTPVGLDALSRQYLGWSQPQYPLDNALTTFVAALSSPTAPIMLMKPAVSTSEYWLVENRPPTGWDAGMYTFLGPWDGGLLIQHIDLNVGTKGFNDFNAYLTGPHQGAMVVEPASATCSIKLVGTSSAGCKNADVLRWKCNHF